MNPEKMEDFHMDLLGNLREHYQESVESDMWLCPKMRRTRKNASFIGKMVRIHWNCGVALIFLANPYVFFKKIWDGHGWFTNVYYLEKRMDESTKLMSPTAQRI